MLASSSSNDKKVDENVVNVAISTADSKPEPSEEKDSTDDKKSEPSSSSSTTTSADAKDTSKSSKPAFQLKSGFLSSSLASLSASSSSSSSSSSTTTDSKLPVWDPFVNMTNRHPTKECLQRVRGDLKSLMKDPLPGIYVVPDENYNTILHALIIGPFDTPYEGGFFYFIINCSDEYPHQPPKVKIMTTGSGQVRFNPNLYANGKVCLSILGTWSGPSWSPVHSLSSVLLSIQSLMNEKPYHNEPGFEASNITACNNYNDIIRHETIRVAVCEMIKLPTSSSSSSNTSSSSSSCNSNTRTNNNNIPEPLQNVMQSLFTSFFDSYELVCQSNIHRDGQAMTDPFGEKRGYFVYKSLLTKLQEINSVLEAKLDNEEEDDEDEEEVDG